MTKTMKNLTIISIIVGIFSSLAMILYFVGVFPLAMETIDYVGDVEYQGYTFYAEPKTEVWNWEDEGDTGVSSNSMNIVKDTDYIGLLGSVRGKCFHSGSSGCTDFQAASISGKLTLKSLDLDSIKEITLDSMFEPGTIQDYLSYGKLYFYVSDGTVDEQIYKVENKYLNDIKIEKKGNNIWKVYASVGSPETGYIDYTLETTTSLDLSKAINLKFVVVGEAGSVNTRSGISYQIYDIIIGSDVQCVQDSECSDLPDIDGFDKKCIDGKCVLQEKKKDYTVFYYITATAAVLGLLIKFIFYSKKR